MSDQLAESSRELELELREELDLALRSARDAHRHRDAALETLTDRELTITKFRELTSQLQEQCVQLQTRVQSTELTQLNTRGKFFFTLFISMFFIKMFFKVPTNNLQKFWIFKKHLPKHVHKQKL